MKNNDSSIIGAMRRLKWRLLRRLGIIRSWTVHYIEGICGKRDFCWPKPWFRKRALGAGDGEWTVSRSKTPNNCLVYSFGVGNDVSFDLDIISAYGATVHAFDPTPLAETWINQQQLPNEFHFHCIGLSDKDGVEMFSLPPTHEVSFVKGASQSDSTVECKVNRWGTIVSNLGHTAIDVLKIDIEGAEYDVIEDIIRSPVYIGQILIEFHHRGLFNKTLEDTRNAVNLLRENGWKLFHISARGIEYSFINKKPCHHQ